jgi:4'-phosphopantetheinyl transferase EntD
MNTWKTVSTFRQAQAPEWEAYVERSLGSKIHPARKHSHILAREALRLILCEIGEAPAISDLIIKDYHSLEKWPEFTLSLSHSKTRGAALLAKKENYLSVGIDIEEEERHIKEAILKRVTHPNDLSLRNIELWCLKEAVFKCLMNSGRFEKPFEFSEIQLLDKRWKHSPSKLEGEWKIIISEQHVIAMAFLENESSSLQAPYSQ